jgi:hypothetical protein
VLIAKLLRLARFGIRLVFGLALLRFSLGAKPSVQGPCQVHVTPSDMFALDESDCERNLLVYCLIMPELVILTYRSLTIMTLTQRNSTITKPNDYGMALNSISV